MPTPATVIIHDHDRDYGFYVNLDGYIDDGVGLDLMNAVNALGVAESAQQIVDGCQGHDCNAIQFDTDNKTFVIHAYDNEPVEDAYYYEPLSRGERIYDATSKNLLVDHEDYCYVLDVVNQELGVWLDRENVYISETLLKDLDSADIRHLVQKLEEHSDCFGEYLDSLKQTMRVFAHPYTVRER